MSRSRRAPLRIAALGYYGIGNLGNEALLAMFLDRMRTQHPEAELRVFALDAEAVRRHHGVAATAFTLSPHHRTRTESGGRVRGALRRLADLPRILVLVGLVDIVVVPGSGALESQLGLSAWGLPYWLSCFALACHLRGRDLALVGVGAEVARRPLTRWLHRRVLALTPYCTFRDDTSRAAAQRLGADPSPGSIGGDLYFGGPPPHDAVPVPGRVVVGVMAYDGPPGTPGRGAPVRAAYLERTTRLVTGLLDAGRTVTLVVGDVADLEVARELDEAVCAARPVLDEGRLRTCALLSLEAVGREMAHAETVVASRYHSLIAALRLGRPVVSLGYSAKSADLLARFGLGERAHDITAYDVDTVLAQLLAEAPDPGRANRPAQALADIVEAVENQLVDLDRRLDRPLDRHAAAPSALTRQEQPS